MAPKFALLTKGSKLPLKKGFKNMFELLVLRSTLDLCCYFMSCNTYPVPLGRL